MQSIPLGSSVEYKKQLNAVLKSSPHGPSAMPPRHGQSQLISPVSGLNAPCWPASASSAAGDPSAGAASDCLVLSSVGFCVVLVSTAAGSGRAWICLRFSARTESTVGTSSCEKAAGGGTV